MAAGPIAPKTFEQERQEREQKRLQEQQATNQEQASQGVISTGYDALRSGLSGLAKGVRRMPAMVGDTINLADTAWQELAGFLLEKTGAATSEQVAGMKKPLPGVEDRTFRGGFPTSAVPDAVSEKLVGPDYKPQTQTGRVVGTVAEFAPAAISPGQLVTRGAPAGQKAWRAAADLFKQAAIPGGATAIAEEEIRDNPNLSPEQKQLLLAAVATGTSVAAHKTLGEPRAGNPAVDVIPGQEGPLHPGTVERVGRDVRRSGGADWVADEMHRIGPEAMPLDTSAALRARAAAVAARNEQSMWESLRARGGRAADSIRQTFDNAFQVRGDENFVERNNQLLEARRQQANDLYGDWRQRAGNVQIDLDPIHNAINQNIAPAVRRPGSNTAPGVIDAEMLRLDDMFRGRNDAESLHHAKLDLDQRIQSARAKEGGGPLVRALEQVRESVLTQLDRSVLNPDGTSAYGHARSTYAGDSAILDARERGARLFRGDNSYTADHMALDMRRMSETERLAFVEGARGNLSQIMEGAANPDGGASAAIRALRSGENQRKLLLLEEGIGGPGGMTRGSARQITDALQGWARIQGSNRTITQNSETARRQEALKDQPDPNAPSTPIAVRAPTWDQLVTGTFQKLGDLVRTRSAEANANRINDETSRLLSMGPGMDPGELRRRLQLLDEAYGRPPGGLPAAVPGAIAGVTAGRDTDRPPLVRREGGPR